MEERKGDRVSMEAKKRVNTNKRFAFRLQGHSHVDGRHDVIEERSIHILRKGVPRKLSLFLLQRNLKRFTTKRERVRRREHKEKRKRKGRERRERHCGEREREREGGVTG